MSAHCFGPMGVLGRRFCRNLKACWFGVREPSAFLKVLVMSCVSFSVMGADPVARWVADDWTGGTSTWVDRVGQKAAVAYGQPVKASGQFAGMSASSGVVFDGVDDYFEVPANNNPIATQKRVTIVALFKATQGATGSDGNSWQFPGPINAESPGGPNDFGLTVGSDGRARAFFNDTIPSASPVSVIDGLPHTMIVTWSDTDVGDGTARFYVDGILQGILVTDGGSGIVKDLIRFGRERETNTRWFRGTVGELRFYASIEDPTEIHRSMTGPTQLLVNSEFTAAGQNGVGPSGWNSSVGFVAVCGASCGGVDAYPAWDGNNLRFGYGYSPVVSQTVAVGSPSSLSRLVFEYEVGAVQVAGSYYVQLDFLNAAGQVLGSLREPSSSWATAPSPAATKTLVLSGASTAWFSQIASARVSLQGTQTTYYWSGHYGAAFGFARLWAYSGRSGAPSISVQPSAGNQSVFLGWTAPSDNGGYAITDYRIQYSTDGIGWTTFDDGVSTATTALITGLSNGTSYRFRVAAVNVSGVGYDSVESASVRPIGPLASISVSGTEDQVVTFASSQFTAAFSNGTGPSLYGVKIAGLPASGTLKLAGNAVAAGDLILAADLGNLSYVPAANESGVKTFEVMASDGSSLSAKSVVDVNLTPVNDAPTISSSGFQKIYETVNPSRNQSGTIVYSQGYGTGASDAASQFSATGQSINRIRYRMDLTVGGVGRYAEATFDGWNGVTAAALRIPDNAVANLFVLQRDVSNLSVDSNYQTVTVGSGFTGRLEIWPYDYSPTAVISLPGGSSATYDFNDTYSPGSNGHGSFQIHNLTRSETVFAWNRHRYGEAPEIGFGTNPNGNPDWTFGSLGSVGWKLQISVEAPPVPSVFAFTEDAAGNLTFFGAPFADIDGDPLTVTLSVPDGTLTAANGPGVTVGGTGVARSFSGSVAALNAYFTTPGNVTYQGPLNGVGNRTLTTTVSDGALSASSTSVLVTSPVNDAPIVSLSQQPTAAQEQVAIAVDAALTLSDVDNSTSASATVGLSGGFVSSEDVLAYVNPGSHGNITGSYEASAGVLTLTSAGATATLEQWQSALRAVTYLNTSDTPNTADRTVRVVINDGLLDSAAVTKTLTVAPMNDAPVATSQSVTTAEDTAKVITLTGSDVEGSPLTYSVLTQPTQGVLSGTPPNLTYTPKANVNGSDSFTFKVNDGSLDSQPTTVSITITPVNDAPVFSGLSTTYDAFTGFVEGPALQSAANRWQYLGGSVSHLTLLTSWKTGGNEVISGVPQWDGYSGYLNNYPFVQRVGSARPPVAEGTLVIHPANSDASVRAVAVGWKNTANKTVSVNFGVTLRLPYSSANGIDYFIQRGLAQTSRYLPLRSGSLVSGGTVALASSGLVEMQPGEMLYLVVDSKGDFVYDHTEVSQFTVTVIQDPALDAVAEDVGSAANPGTAVSVLANAGSDVDSGAVKGIAVTAVDSSHGVWQYSTDGGSTWLALVGVSESAARLLRGNDANHRIRFVPQSEYNGTATITYRSWDQTSGTSAQTDSGLLAWIPFENSLIDAANNSLHGGTWSSGSNGGFSAVVPSDVGAGAYSGVFNGSSRVDLANSETLKVDNGVPFSMTAWIRTGFSDNVQRVILAKALSGASSGNHTAALFVSSNGRLRFDNFFVNMVESVTPVRTGNWVHVAVTYDGTDFRLFVDGILDAVGRFSGSNETPATWTFSVGESLNTAFPGGTFVGNIDEVGFWNRTLTPSEVLSVRTSGISPTVNLTSTGGSTAYSANSGTATITVTAVNDAPIVSLSQQPTAAQEQVAIAVDAALTLSDVDNSTLASATVGLSGGFASSEDVLAYVNPGSHGNITGSYAASAGVLTLTSAGATATLEQWQSALRAVTYLNTSDTPNTADRTVRVVINDGLLDSAAVTKTLTVAPVNDAPSLVAISVDGTEDTIVTFDPSNSTSAYSDVEETPLVSIKVVSLPTTGTLKLAGNPVIAGQVIPAQSLANLTYIPAANENGAKTFKVSASDGLLSSPEATVTINLAAVNDAPIASGEATLPPINEDGGVASNGQPVGDLFAANFSDSTDGGQSTLAGVGVSSHVPDPSRGAWQYSSDGQNWVALGSASLSSGIALKSSDRLRFVPVSDYNGPATALEVLLIESGGDTITSGASINLSGIGSQVLLSPSSVVGWSSTYSSSFSADRVLDNQTGTVAKDIFGQNYWLGADGAVTAGLIIDLGIATSLSSVELYNASNANYNDSGTIKFHIELASAITGNSPTTYALVNPVNAVSGIMSPATVGVAPTAQSFFLNTSGIQPRYLRFVVDSSTKNNPGLNEIRIFSVTGSNGGSTVYSQASVPLKHTVNPVNDAPLLTSVTPLTGATEDTDFTISYQALAAAADESDVDSANLQFRIESVSSGTLTLGGAPISAGSTLLAPGQSLVWRPALDANGVIEAFKVRAWDGELASAVAVPVTVSVAAVADPISIEGLLGVSRVYDGTRIAAVTGSPVLKGLASGADVQLTGTPVFLFAQAGVSDAPVQITVSGYTLTGAQAADYSLTLPTLSAKITPKSVTVTGLSGVDKVYDGTTLASATGKAAPEGTLLGDEVTVGGTPLFAFASPKVGTGITITTTGYTLSGAQSGNYSLVQPTLTAKITPKPLTVTGLTGNNKSYDGTTAATVSGTAKLSGVVSGDESKVTLIGTQVYAFASANVGTGIAINTTGFALSGDSAGNYSLTQPTLSANITTDGLVGGQLIAFSQSSLSIPANGQITINQSSQLPPGALVERVVFTFEYSTYWSSSAVAGNFVKLNGADLPGSGWTSLGTGGSWRAQTTVYQGILPSFNRSGANAWTVGSAWNPVSLRNATMTIYYWLPGKLSQTLTFGALANVTYGVADIPLTGSASSGLPVGWEVASGPGRISGSSLVVQGAGLIVVRASQAGDSVWFAAQPVERTLVVDKKPASLIGLTVSDKVYDGAVSAKLAISGATLSGVLSGDVGAVVLDSAAATGSFNTSAVGASKPVTISQLTLSGTAAGNYSLTQPTLSANITPRPLTVGGLSGVDKVYDGTTLAMASGTATLAGIVQGEAVTLAGTPVFNFANSKVGAGISIATTGYTLSGTQAGNYSLTQPTLSANITPRPVRIAILAASRAYLAVSPAFGFEAVTGQLAPGDSTADLIGGQGSAADLVYRLASTTVASPVGVYPGEITVDPASVDGAKASNYSVQLVAGELRIVAAALKITIDTSTLVQSYTGSRCVVGWSTQPTGVAVRATYNGSATPPVVAGTYPVILRSDDPNYAGEASAVLVIRTTMESLKSDGFLVVGGLLPVGGGDGRYLLEASMGQAVAGSLPVVLGIQVESGFWFAGALADALSGPLGGVPTATQAAKGLAALRPTTVASQAGRALETQEPQVASGVRLPEARLSVSPAADAARVRVVVSGIPGARWKVQHLDGSTSERWQDSGFLQLDPEGFGVIETGSGGESAVRFYRLVQP